MEYPLHDLVIHTFDLLPFFERKFLNGIADDESIASVLRTMLELIGEEASDPEARFRQFVHDQFVDGRSFALKAIEVGITLNSKYYVRQ